MCELAPQLLSTVAVAAAMGVGESSVKRWVDLGVLVATKTPGGHRRIAVGDLYRFLLATGKTLADPSAVGLSSEAGASISTYRASCREALALGDAHALESAIQIMRLSGMTATSVTDNVLYPAFGDVRSSCSHPSEECRVLHRALLIIQHAMPAALSPGNQPPSNARRRIVYADIGDEVDAAPTFFAEASMWDAAEGLQLGVGVPRPVIEGALEPFRADTLWLSASGPRGRAELEADWSSIATRAAALNVKVYAFGNLAERLTSAGQVLVTSFSDFRAQTLSAL